jgi:hypothetical protein
MAFTVCAPLVVELKVKLARPSDKARAEVWVTPSTDTVRVPVGTAALEFEADATEMVTRSLAPEAGVVVAAVSEVVLATGDEDEAPGQAKSKL